MFYKGGSVLYTVHCPPERPPKRNIRAGTVRYGRVYCALLLHPMLRFYQKKTFRRVLYSKGAFIALALIFFWGLKATWGIYQKEVEARAHAQEARTILAQLKGREQFLRAELDRLSTHRGVEAEIRKKFPLVKEGEEVAVVIDPPKESATATPEASEPSLWGRLWHALVGR